MAETTFYPDASPESTSVDGRVYKTNGTSWALAHDATTGEGASDSDGNLNGLFTFDWSGSTYQIARSAYLFDTSSLGSGQAVDAAVFSIVPSTVTDVDGFSICLVQSNLASNTAVVAADYDQIGDAVANPTEGATRKAISTYSTGSYQAQTLDATGRGWVDVSGITKLGLRTSPDCDDDPTGLSVDTISTRIICYNADQAGTSSDPKLVVTHSDAAPAGTNSGFFAMM